MNDIFKMFISYKFNHLNYKLNINLFLQALSKLIRREELPILIMFYAPWCGFCKQLKPDFSGAATELRGHSLFAAIDVNRPENAAVRHLYNITGFPTLIYFK